jgi:type II secretory pathway component PulC
MPLLTILFLLSYGLMTMLIVEQGQTIESQRALIRELLHDSIALSALKGSQAQHQLAQNQTQNPSTQAQTKQAPSSQADPQVRTESEAAKQKPFRMPTRPASDLADKARALITI